MTLPATNNDPSTRPPIAGGPRFPLTHDVLNTATKYRSIPTYHHLNTKGVLDETDTVTFTGPVTVTEKVDGQNVRLIFLPDGRFVIGTRTDLLYCAGDYLCNTTHGIVAAVHDVVALLRPPPRDAISVYYLEIFGGAGMTQASKQYTGARTIGLRLFDAAVLRDYESLLTMTPEQVAGWRDHGGVSFLPEDELCAITDHEDLLLVPRLRTVLATELPATVEEAHAWVREVLPGGRTLVALDSDARGGAEGVVLSGQRRDTVAKMRLVTYQRTAQLHGQLGGRG